MHPIKFTSKLKSLYQYSEEFKQGKKTNRFVAYYTNYMYKHVILKMLMKY